MKAILLLVVIAAFIYTSEAKAQSFCDKYAAALSVNDSYLVQQVVTKTVDAAIASGDSQLKQFF